ncbi:MAG TPA: dihydroneopterin aldolase [Firmicutes bacterium]|nr:dihydroneopterin aldolase [Bacillota bacterium]HHY97636.1 dihydroneopterin aldolase [Bacillota bacterium]
MGEDKILLKDMVFYGYHGAFSAEKELGQRFEVDVEMVTDLSQAAQMDDVELSVNYVDVYTLVKDIVEEREFNLIETLAETICQEILAAYAVREVTVRVRKPHAPLGGLLGYVQVEITRRPEQ